MGYHLSAFICGKKPLRCLTPHRSDDLKPPPQTFVRLTIKITIPNAHLQRQQPWRAPCNAPIPDPKRPNSLARQIYADLLGYLPQPPNDTPEARLIRDSRAMAAVAALIPENAAEAELAITAIATDFHAKDALAAASRPNLTIDALKNLRGMTASIRASRRTPSAPSA